jgi:hypothetical protein
MTTQNKNLTETKTSQTVKTTPEKTKTNPKQGFATKTASKQSPTKKKVKISKEAQKQPKTPKKQKPKNQPIKQKSLMYRSEHTPYILNMHGKQSKDRQTKGNKATITNTRQNNSKPKGR